MEWIKLVQGTTREAEVPKVKVSRWGTNIPQNEYGLADLWHSGCKGCDQFQRNVIEQESGTYGKCPFTKCDVQVAGKKLAPRELRTLVLREETAAKKEAVREFFNGVFSAD